MDRDSRHWRTFLVLNVDQIRSEYQTVCVEYFMCGLIMAGKSHDLMVLVESHHSTNCEPYGIAIGCWDFAIELFIEFKCCIIEAVRVVFQKMTNSNRLCIIVICPFFVFFGCFSRFSAWPRWRPIRVYLSPSTLQSHFNVSNHCGRVSHPSTLSRIKIINFRVVAVLIFISEFKLRYLR